MLDKIDTKIVYHLSIDCRIPLATLAKKLKISRNTLTYRIHRLEETKVIKQYECITTNIWNEHIYVRHMIKTKHRQDVEEIIKQLATDSEIVFLATFYGDYDIGIAIRSTGLQEIHRKTMQLWEKIAKHVEKHSITFGYTIYHCAPMALFPSHQNIEPIEDVYTGKVYRKISENEKQILEKIQQNPNISILDLSKKVHMTPKSCLSNMRKLKEIILRNRVLINYQKLGYERYHIFWSLQHLTTKNATILKEYLLQHKNTIYVTIALGMHAIESEFIVKDQDELFCIIQEMESKHPQLLSTYTILRYKEIIRE